MFNSSLLGWSLWYAQVSPWSTEGSLKCSQEWLESKSNIKWLDESCTSIWLWGVQLLNVPKIFTITHASYGSVALNQLCPIMSSHSFFALVRTLKSIFVHQKWTQLSLNCSVSCISQTVLPIYLSICLWAVVSAPLELAFILPCNNYQAPTYLREQSGNGICSTIDQSSNYVSCRWDGTHAKHFVFFCDYLTLEDFHSWTTVQL